MRISDLLAMCVRNLTRRKFRTFLTVVGVVVGTTSIVVMISLGEGINASSEEFLQSAGDLSLIEVYGPTGNSPDTILDDDMVAEIARMDGVSAVSPLSRFRSLSATLYSGKKDRYAYYSWYLIGLEPSAMEELGHEVEAGEMLSDAKGGKKIKMVMGPEAVYQFEDTKKRWPNNMIWADRDAEGNLPEPFFDPLTSSYTLVVQPGSEDGKELRYEVEVVGILAPKGRYDDSTYSMYMDIADMKRIEEDYKKANQIKKNDSDRDSIGYDNVHVKVGDISKVGAVEAAIGQDGGLGFYTYSLGSIRESYEENARQIQLILGALGFISLFVAAISITNTMIMSVYERTREIGVMKVLGCLVSNIRTIFLVEAGLIGFFGGVLGIGLSYLLSFLMNTFGGYLGDLVGSLGMMGEGSRISIIPPWLVALGMIFATTIGIVSGFYPANRAVKISALEAIRTE